MSFEETSPEFAAGGKRKRARSPGTRFSLLVLPVIAAGGVLGALARNGIAVALPHQGTGFPWATFVANAVGCLLIGFLMTTTEELPSVHRMLRPFLGVGVLGGFTTFSTYAVETRQLIERAAGGWALLYLFGTLVVALGGILAGMVAARLAIGVTRNGRNYR